MEHQKIPNCCRSILQFCCCCYLQMFRSLQKNVDRTKKATNSSRLIMVKYSKKQKLQKRHQTKLWCVKIFQFFGTICAKVMIVSKAFCESREFCIECFFVFCCQFCAHSWCSQPPKRRNTFQRTPNYCYYLFTKYTPTNTIHIVYVCASSSLHYIFR